MAMSMAPRTYFPQITKVALLATNRLGRGGLWRGAGAGEEVVVEDLPSGMTRQGRELRTLDIRRNLELWRGTLHQLIEGGG